MRRITVIAMLTLCALAPGAARGGEPPPEELSALRGIAIDLKAHRLTIEGRVCLDNGVLEYLAVVKGGKEYESVLALKCQPRGLHAALLLIGAVPGDLDPRFAEDAALPDTVTPKGRAGSRVNIRVRWKQGDLSKEVPATSFLLNRKTNQPPPPMPWVFTGSYFIKDPDTGKEVYMADLDGSLVASFYDPTALLNLPAAAGNPYRGDRLGFALNPDTVPPVDTKVEVIFELAKAGEDEALGKK